MEYLEQSDEDSEMDKHTQYRAIGRRKSLDQEDADSGNGRSRDHPWSGKPGQLVLSARLAVG
jgi:hypothetical protein